MKKKLLIIEDEISVAKQLKWELGKDYDITIANGVEEANRQLREQNRRGGSFAAYSESPRLALLKTFS